MKFRHRCLKYMMICCLILPIFAGLTISDGAKKLDWLGVWKVAINKVNMRISENSEGKTELESELKYGKTGIKAEKKKNIFPWNRNTLIHEIEEDPVFEPFGRLIFPVNEGYMQGSTLKDLDLVWYTHINPDKTVEVVNTLRENALQNKTVFFDLYSPAEKRADPAKADTGLFYFPGNPGEKFAVCSAGGGFAYVGAIHDSFPHALELSHKGYHGFVLIYRPGWQSALEDLDRAVSVVFEKAEELDIDTRDYSLWGGSAGARMSAALGTYGPGSFGGKTLPKPAAVIMQYTGQREYSRNDPPTYMNAGMADGIASWKVMKARADAMKAAGIDVEFHAFPGLGHGYGLGEGTSAQGWLDDAVDFWQKHMKES